VFHEFFFQTTLTCLCTLHELCTLYVLPCPPTIIYTQTISATVVDFGVGNYTCYLILYQTIKNSFYSQIMIELTLFRCVGKKALGKSRPFSPWCVMLMVDGYSFGTVSASANQTQTVILKSLEAKLPLRVFFQGFYSYIYLMSEV